MERNRSCSKEFSGNSVGELVEPHSRHQPDLERGRETSTNQPLSLNRANAVRSYLVSRGVAAEKISAIGMGSKVAVADNATAENRANNRRVEIVIGAATVTTR